jgi:hypothetical protein
MPAPSPPGHQSVPRARPQARADVQPRRHRGHHDRPGQEPHPRPHRLRRGQQPQRRVHHEAHHQDVGDRADSGPLAQWYPREQHEDGCPDDNLPERRLRSLGQPLVQHVPGVQAQPCPNNQRNADPVQEQSDEQPGQPIQRPIDPVHGNNSSSGDWEN